MVRNHLTTAPASLDWNQLRVFQIAANTESFTRAGMSLGLSQSAVSRQIASLERSLKVSLFYRKPPRLILTEAGKEFHKSVTGMVERLAMGIAQIDEFRGASVGPLRIATSVVFGSSWLTERIIKLKTLYPEMMIALLLSDNIEVDLLSREADISIRFIKQTQSNLIQRHLMTIRFGIYASREYVARKGKPSQVSDLDHHDLLAYGADLPAHAENLDWLLEVGRSPGDPRVPLLRASSVYAILHAVRSGIGLGALPYYVCDGTDDLVEVAPTIKGPCIEAFLVYPEEIRHSRRILVATDFLFREAKRDAQQRDGLRRHATLA